MKTNIKPENMMAEITKLVESISNKIDKLLKEQRKEQKCKEYQIIRMQMGEDTQN